MTGSEKRYLSWILSLYPTSYRQAYGKEWLYVQEIMLNQSKTEQETARFWRTIIIENSWLALKYSFNKMRGKTTMSYGPSDTAARWLERAGYFLQALFISYSLSIAVSSCINSLTIGTSELLLLGGGGPSEELLGPAFYAILGIVISVMLLCVGYTAKKRSFQTIMYYSACLFAASSVANVTQSLTHNAYSEGFSVGGSPVFIMQPFSSIYELYLFVIIGVIFVFFIVDYISRLLKKEARLPRLEASSLLSGVLFFVGTVVLWRMYLNTAASELKVFGFTGLATKTGVDTIQTTLSWDPNWKMYITAVVTLICAWLYIMLRSRMQFIKAVTFTIMALLISVTVSVFCYTQSKQKECAELYSVQMSLRMTLTEERASSMPKNSVWSIQKLENTQKIIEPLLTRCWQ